MSRFRALLAYEELLRTFYLQTAKSASLEETLERGFGYLLTRLRLEGVSLFWWNPQRKHFTLQYSFHNGVLLEGEEEIMVDAMSPLTPLVDEQQPVVISESKPWVAFVPLRAGTDLLGAVRIVRRHGLPLGKVLASLPALHEQARPHARVHALLDDLADILALKIQQLSRDEKNRRRAQSLKAASDVATAVFERPRLRDMLQAVSESIVTRLNFDRIRFYLLDSEHSELKGILGLQIPNRTLNLEREIFPLKPGVNSLVDAVLRSTGDPAAHLVGGRVAYVPLIINGQIIGCFAVDNLLSQQLIDEEQMESLRALAAQIGMAVLNARLFEDIEQQAITDGLTKLYVYRYFQERLKEEIDRADRYRYGIALVMMDVDHFKKLNDTYGHLFGDRVLEMLAQTIKGNIRRIDLAARYAGDEFVLVLPEITEQEAWLMGARLLTALRKNTLTAPNGEPVNVGVTMGVAMYPSDSQNGRDLIEAADRALYWCKKNKRGDICFYREAAKDVEKSA